MSGELLKQVRVLDPESGRDEVADVLIADGQIRAIASAIADYPDHTRVRDGECLVLGPGLVDLYSHTGEPGFEERETLESLGKAAIAGGFTRLGILPDMIPSADNPATVGFLQSRVPAGFHLWGAMTRGAAGEQMTELGELAASGIVGFADGHPLQRLALLRRILEYLHPLNVPIALYCCDRQLASNGVMREGDESIYAGLPGLPGFAETAALAAVLELVEATGTPVHIMRVSTARGVELIRDAKRRGLPITASTTWMHLLFDTEAVSGKRRRVLGSDGSPSSPFPIPYDPSLNLDPPLGNPADRTALIAGIGEGILDAIAVDHAPHTYEEKTVAFADTPPGAIGLELALPLLWETFVTTEKWSPLQLWRALSTAPARCWQQTPPSLQIDRPAELTLFDPRERWIVNGTTIQSRSANTPWWGQELTGRVVETWWL